MFKGVVHGDARLILATLIPSLPAHVHVLCSGNFTSESTLRFNGYAGRLTGCDVSLYTSAMGWFLAGEDFRLEVNPDVHPELNELAGYLTDPLMKAATVCVATEIMQFARQKNHFERRMYRAHVKRLRQLVDDTAAKLDKHKGKLRLDEYHAQDAQQRIREIPSTGGHCVLAFPPTYSGDYAKQYAAVESLFTWDVPEYGPLVAGDDFARMIVESVENWAILSEKQTDSLDELLGQPVGRAARGGTKNVVIYTNLGVTQPKLVRRTVAAKEVRSIRRLSDRDELREDAQVSILLLDGNEAAYIRQLYSAVKPLQSGCPFNYAILVDGMLVGICMFAMSTRQCNFGNEAVSSHHIIYMMSDLPVASDTHQRLSKLVVKCAASREMQTILASRVVSDIQYILTTAFSKNPVSMKYRGPYKLHKRTPAANGGYELNYYTQMGRWSLQEAYQQWWKKDYKKQKHFQQQIIQT